MKKSNILLRRVSGKIFYFYWSRFITALFLLLFCFTPTLLFGFEPVDIREGTLINAELTGEAVEMLDLEELLLNRRLKPEDNPRGASMREPAAGKSFLILEVVLSEDKSIGRYDYTLQFKGDNQVYRCLAMADEAQVFDPRLWELKSEEVGTAPVRLLYEVDSSDGEAAVLLVPVLDLTIKPPTVEFTIGGDEDGGDED